MDSLDVIADSGQGKFGSIVAIFRVVILVGNSTGTSVRTTKTVEANDEEARHIECLTRTAEEGTPPVSDIGAATQSMADHQHIVSVGGECASCGVCNGDIG